MLKHKQRISLLLALSLLFCLSACSMIKPLGLLLRVEQESEGDPPGSESSTETTTNTETETEISPEVEETPIRNLILIIGDGMGPEHIAAGQLGSGAAYPFTSWPNVNVNTDSVDPSGNAGVLTDSAAGATALATGNLTVNSYLGIDPYQRPLQTVLDVAKEYGKSTGILTTDYLYGATPAGFSAHSNNRSDYDRITETQATSGVDFLCGLRNDSHYSSYRSLLQENGYAVCNTVNGIRDASAESEKLYLTVNIENNAADSLPLSSLALMAISFLENDEDGFVLIIEQAHIDKNAHNNSINGVVSSVNSLAQTVETVMEWIGDREDTAVLVTADHETGGLTVSSQPVFAEQYFSATGNFFYSFSSTKHTDLHVKLFVYGIAPAFRNCTYYRSEYLIKNTDVFQIMKQLLITESK